MRRASRFSSVSVSHHVFLVENHALMRAALSTLIGFEPDLELCGMAGSAEDAIDQEVWAGCDLLLTDVSLPGVDGLELAARARRERPDLPVVVVSASVDPATVRRAKEVGVRAYLSKAKLGETLVPMLREVLSSDSPGGPGGPATLRE